MQSPEWTDLDYLAARVHGRLSRLGQGAGLDRLCQIRTLPELSRALDLPLEVSPLALQRRMVEDLLAELSSVAARLPEPGQAVLAWMRVRFQVENLKVLARGLATGRPPETVEPHLLPLPPDLRLPPADAGTGPSDLLALVPPGPLRTSLEELPASARAAPRTFLLEAALDRGYLREYRRRADRIRGNEGRYLLPLVQQELDTFHLGLAARGVGIHRLPPDQLLPFHVDGAGISSRVFAGWLGAADLAALARDAVGRAIDEAPTAVKQPDTLEALAWNRLFRLATGTFRRSHLGVAAVVAYIVLRRIELANLITLSEGIRAGLSPAALRDRLIPRTLAEAVHV